MLFASRRTPPTVRLTLTAVGGGDTEGLWAHQPETQSEGRRPPTRAVTPIELTLPLSNVSVNPVGLMHSGRKTSLGCSHAAGQHLRRDGRQRPPR